MKFIKFFLYFSIISMFIGCGNVGVTDDDKNIKIIEGNLINTGPIYNANVCVKTLMVYIVI